MKTWIMIVGLLVWIGTVVVLRADGKAPGPPVPFGTVQALDALIGSQLPPGWTVSFDAGTSEITIRKAKKVLGKWVGSNSPVFEEMVPVNYILQLRVESLISINEYARFCTENEVTNARIKEQEEVLLKTPTASQMMGDYTASGEPGKSEVLKYHRLLALRHALPDCYYRNISLFWKPCLNFMSSDDGFEEERELVSDNVSHLLTPYLDQKISQKTVHALMGKLSAQLPRGWSVSYDDGFHLIHVTRMEPTSMVSVSNGPNAGQNSKPEEGRFSFTLKVIPFMTPGDYEWKTRNNVGDEKEISRLQELLSKSPSVQGIQGGMTPGTRWHSEVQKEQSLIHQYYHLQRRLYELPDGYFNDISLAWKPSYLTGTSGPMPADEEIQRECEAVFQNLKRIPSKY